MAETTFPHIIIPIRSLFIFMVYRFFRERTQSRLPLRIGRAAPSPEACLRQRTRMPRRLSFGSGPILIVKIPSLREKRLRKSFHPDRAARSACHTSPPATTRLRHGRTLRPATDQHDGMRFHALFPSDESQTFGRRSLD